MIAFDRAQMTAIKLISPNAWCASRSALWKYQFSI